MKRRILNIGVVVVLFGVLLAGFLYAGHKTVRQMGYSGIQEYLSGSVSNYARGVNTTPTVIELNIDKDDIQKMREQREEAVLDGVMLNIGDNYVDAKVGHNGSSVKAEIRLKGHMTDHLQDDKWSFRVKLDKGEHFMGMRRFTLQHPGTRNYIYEWVFHQIAKQEGLVHLTYDFVEVKVNGESWGIYALEEHFGQELLARNERPAGPILRFDPYLYWQGRMDELANVKYVEDHTSFYATHIDPYDEGEVLKSKPLKASVESGQRLLEALRSGKKQSSEVFDVPKMATYLAIIDLVGGHRSLDWSDVKFYVNPSTNLIEPVAYESFGVRPVKFLAGQRRYKGEPDGSDFHELLFSDTTFYHHYMEAVARLSQDDYVKHLFEGIAPELAGKLAILGREFPEKPINKQLYYNNARTIRGIIDAPKPLKVFLQDMGERNLELVIANTSGFPMIVDGLGYKGKVKALETALVIPPKQSRKLSTHQLHKVPNPFDEAPDELDVHYHIPGGKRYVEPAIGYRFELEFEEPKALPEVDLDTLIGKSLLVDSTTREMWLVSGNWSGNLIIPEDFTLRVQAGTQLTFSSLARLTCRGRLLADGTVEEPIKISSADLGTLSVHLFGDHFHRITGVYWKDQTEEACVRSNETTVHITNCVFEDNLVVVEALRSTIVLDRVAISDPLNAVIGVSSHVKAKRLTIRAGFQGFDLANSSLDAQNLTCSNLVECITLRDNSLATGKECDIGFSETGVSVTNNSEFNVPSVTVTDSDRAFVFGAGVSDMGRSAVRIASLEAVDCKVIKTGEVGVWEVN